MNIEISTEHLGQDIGTMQSQLDALNAARQQVFRCVENLNTMWDGAAHSVFVMQTLRDSMKFQQLMNKLQNLVECLEYAQTEYNKCSDSVNEKIASIRLSNDT